MSRDLDVRSQSDLRSGKRVFQAEGAVPRRGAAKHSQQIERKPTCRADSTLGKEGMAWEEFAEAKRSQMARVLEALTRSLYFIHMLSEATAWRSRK